MNAQYQQDFKHIDTCDVHTEGCRMFLLSSIQGSDVANARNVLRI